MSPNWRDVLFARQLNNKPGRTEMWPGSLLVAEWWLLHGPVNVDVEHQCDSPIRGFAYAARGFHPKGRAVGKKVTFLSRFIINAGKSRGYGHKAPL